MINEWLLIITKAYLMLVCQQTWQSGLNIIIQFGKNFNNKNKLNN